MERKTSMPILSINNITKSFGNTQALHSISFDVQEGEIVALLGPSGCGKSTLLFVIAGLEVPDSGDILWKGLSIKDKPPHLRGFGLMFQDFALFPHMDVYANIAFGLRMARTKSSLTKLRVQEMLQLVGMPGFRKRDVSTLSGGEQQRIALARALAPQPQLLMLDEPLGSLDRNLRERLVGEIQAILKHMHQTAIYVTHDQEEAFTIADRIILLNSGHVEQIGTPREIYTNPATLFVARFLNMKNIIDGEIHTQNGKKILNSAVGDFFIETSLVDKVQLLIRPDGAQLDNAGPKILKGSLIENSFRGNTQRVTLDINHILVDFEFPSNVDLPQVGSEISVSLDPKQAFILFPA